MKPPPQQQTNRRGQPLAALSLLLLAWVGARTALYAAAPLPVSDNPAEEKTAPRSVQPDPLADPQKTNRRPEEIRRSAPQVLPPAPAPAPRVTPPKPQAAPMTATNAENEILSPKVAAGHQMLFLAGTAAMPVPENPVAVATPIQPAAPLAPYLSHARSEAMRWSADGWILWREGGSGLAPPSAGLPGAGLPSGAYGASQAGFVLRYRLTPNHAFGPLLYLRASGGLYRPRGEELAIGVALRPVKAVPVAVMAEGRVMRASSRTVVRPAAALVTQLPPARLPLGVRAETYAQAGWVGGSDATLFVDGQLRVDRAVAKSGNTEFRLGAGTWGGAQRGARRLDVGPSATVDVPVGPVRARLSADYRVRVAGDAAPGSGVAVTFSAGF